LFGALALTLALPGLGMIAGFAGALAAGLKRAGLLIALIAAPLQLPLLVFASGATRAAVEGSDLLLPNLMMTAAGSLAAIALGPFAIAATLRARLS
jgi:heme exporter protein B